MLGRLWTTSLLFPFLVSSQNSGWSHYHGSPANTKYSALKQINTANVSQLKPAWVFDTGDAYKDSEMQSNPLVIGSTIYLVSPKLRLFAVDAATGKQKWVFDPNLSPVSGKMRNRGLTYWTDGKSHRLYLASRQWYWSIDALTGKPDPSFGDGGKIDLRQGLGRPVEGLSVSVSTPGVIYKDHLIIGSIVSEGLPAAPGFIRSLDPRTGKVKWVFKTIPSPGEFGYDTWPRDAHEYIGGANSWAGLALDEARGIVFAPTGSAAFDFYGANRHGDNLFANCLIALDANTGKRLWHFQFVKHDVWDRDLPSAPTLATIKREGKPIDAVVQITKSGHVWAFDRITGKSLFPFEEIDVPASDIDGELLANKQVLPLKPAPFARQLLTEDQLTNRTPEARKAVLERFRRLRNGPQFTPPSREGTIILPGFDGGGEWGGGAYDPETGIFYINANEFAWILRLIPRKPGGGRAVTSRTLYSRNCASCHKEDLGGSPPEFPSLKNLAANRSAEQVAKVIRDGAGRMPGFAHLREPAVRAIANFILSGKEEAVEAVRAADPRIELKYNLDGYVRFTDPDGYPAIAPPWGTLNALDLTTGEYRWRIPFGEFPALAAQWLSNTGSENYGGAVVTAGGLLFIGATNADHKFRAFDKLTGKLLWEYTMDAAGNATPATYEVNGKQYVVIGAGGGKWGNVSGGKYYAFALPSREPAREP
jgi:quinoprotein glucose dehydrogenase